MGFLRSKKKSNMCISVNIIRSQGRFLISVGRPAVGRQIGPRVHTRTNSTNATASNSQGITRPISTWKKWIYKLTGMLATTDFSQTSTLRDNFLLYSGLAWCR